MLTFCNCLGLFEESQALEHHCALTGWRFFLLEAVILDWRFLPAGRPGGSELTAKLPWRFLTTVGYDKCLVEDTCLVIGIAVGGAWRFFN